LPILNTRIQAEARDQQGKPVSIPLNMALQQAGPRLQITLSPLEEQIKLLAGQGKDLPTPVTGHALIDTGSSVTCIDQDAANKAGLAVVESGPMDTATHVNEIVPIYAGRLSIEGFPNNIETKRAYGASLASQGLIVLIGRDTLANCVLVYNGTDSSFSLSL
jgi:predicted aspartyl protease